MAGGASEQWGWLKNTNFVLVCHSNLPCVDGHIDASDLNIIVADARDDLDPLEVACEDGDVAAGSVGNEGDALHTAHPKGLVPNIASTGQDLMALHPGLCQPSLLPPGFTCCLQRAHGSLKSLLKPVMCDSELT